MALVGFQRIGADDEPDSPWMIPSGLSADQLKQSLDLIRQTEFNPPVFDDGKEAEDLIRRKSAGTAARRRTAFDDEFLFPAGGPTAMKKSAALEALKKTRRRRRKSGSDEEGDEGLTEEQRKIRSEARRAKELEKLRKIKSDLYIHDSDEESDEEKDRAFFEQEEKLRQRTALQHLHGLEKSNELLALKQKTSSIGIKRSAQEMSSDSESHDDGKHSRQRSSSATQDDNLLEESENEATDTPLSSSPRIHSSQTKRLRISNKRFPDRDESGEDDKDDALATGRDAFMNDLPIIRKPSGQDDDDDDDDDVPMIRTAPRRRVTSGFVIESSDEE
jgi:replication fork protection complex subunit Tof1/Swi1